MTRETLLLKYPFNKFGDLQAGNFITKRLQHRCFPLNTAKFLKTSCLKDICEQLSLNFIACYLPVRHESQLQNTSFFYFNLIQFSAKTYNNCQPVFPCSNSSQLLVISLVKVKKLKRNYTVLFY